MPTPQLTKALAAAQGAFKEIKKTKKVRVRTREGDAYEFAYAPLEVVMAAVQESLTANGLALTHRMAGGLLYSTLSHESGEERESEFPLKNFEGARIQALGSALTYGQRYATRLLLNLTTDDDDDGAQASGDAPRQQPRHDMQPRQPANEAKKLHTEGPYAGMTVGTKPAAGDPAKQQLEATAKNFVHDSMAAFQTMDAESLTLWWRDSQDQREAVDSLYPDLYQRLIDAMDARRMALKAVSA